MADFSSFPTVRLVKDGQSSPVGCFGKSEDGRKLLVCLPAPLMEKHLGSAVRSPSRLVDERGKPRMIPVYRMLPFCALHGVAWVDEASGCPECKAGQQVG